MKVSLSEISAAFDDLVSGARSRESLAAWANECRKAEDGRQLQYVPVSEETKIWEALVYLTGVDLRSTPSEYLHSTDDFVAYRGKAGV